MDSLRVHLLSVACLVVILAAIVGCSSGGNNNPISPVSAEKETLVAGHSIWGLWQFELKPEMGTIEVTPVRNADLHLNAMHFIEPPAYVNLSVEQVQYTGKTVKCVVNLRHPFLGLVQYTGFDVCGILITNGSLSGFHDPDLVMAGEGETRLLNPDGYTRWWNPAEFPINPGTMLGYQDGMLGVPDSVADYNCTLNAYKYFADELGPDDALDLLSIEGRGMFSAGQKNSRRYIIEIGNDGLVFNYAVDASWKFPTGGPPWEAPDDFGMGANRPEAYRINDTETENSLNPEGGGQLGLEIRVYDWAGAESNEVTIESPGIISPASSFTPDYVGDGYAIYDVLADDCHPITTGELELLVSVASDKSGYGGLLPDKSITAYFTYTTTVSEMVDVNYNLVLTIERNDTDLITGIELDWDDNPGITGYNIYRQNPFDASDDWVLLPASPVTDSEYIDTDITGNEAYQYKVVAKVGANEAPETSVEAYAILENAEDNVNTHCVWETCAFPLMYSPGWLPQSLFNEFAPLDWAPNNGTYCWDESGLQNNPIDGVPDGSYWTGSASIVATPVLPLPIGAGNCQIEFCVRLNNLPTNLPPDFHICGVTVGVTDVVEDGPSNPFIPSQEYIEGLDYNTEHVQGFSDYGNFTNITPANDKGFAYQVDPPPPWENIQYKYSKFALPDVFTIPNARAALAWGCANSCGGTAAPNPGTSFDDIAVLMY